MKKKILNRALIGFLLGMALVVLIPALFNRDADGMVRLFSRGLLDRTGSTAGAMAASLLLYGVYGAFCIGGTLLYEIESWSLARATAVHYLGVMLGYLLADLLLCWEMPLRELLIVEGCMTVSFALIWLVLYLGYRGSVRELNRLREHMEDGQKEESK